MLVWGVAGGTIAVFRTGAEVREGKRWGVGVENRPAAVTAEALGHSRVQALLRSGLTAPGTGLRVPVCHVAVVPVAPL